MVLIVTALIIGAVSVGGDLMRNAAYQRLGSSFIRGWQLSYLSHKEKLGVVVADSQTAPSGYVAGASADGTPRRTEVCRSDLRAAMLSAGVEMPQGRSEGDDTRYAYMDSNGNPQQLEVCFQARDWVVQTGLNSYQNQIKNVMVIKSVTPDLARLIDSLVDTARDAQFGKIRQFPTSRNGGTPTEQEYSLDNTCVFGGGCGSARDEAQVAVMTLYYLMD